MRSIETHLDGLPNVGGGEKMNKEEIIIGNVYVNREMINDQLKEAINPVTMSTVETRKRISELEAEICDLENVVEKMGSELEKAIDRIALLENPTFEGDEGEQQEHERTMLMQQRSVERLEEQMTNLIEVLSSVSGLE